MKIEIYADGANLKDILELNENPTISGFTTNPALMKKAGITDYEKFAKEVLEYIKDKPVSFEVIADDIDEMYRQAKKIDSWGENVYVKIPITNTEGESTGYLIKTLAEEGVKVNVTAILTIKQIQTAIDSLGFHEGIISIFIGRVSDTGKPYDWLITYATKMKKHNHKILWASTRRVYDIIEADIANVDIITVTPDILKKMSLIGRSLEEMSLDTVKMFYNDAKESGLIL